MPPVVPPSKQKRFVKLRQEGWARNQAAAEAGVSESWAYKFEHGHHNNGQSIIAARAESKLPAPIPFDRLGPEALRGWDDFEFFRRFFLGHVSTPWQVETAVQIVERLASPEKEYLIVNCPPGVGKTTLLHDIACWVTVRDRRLRGLIGSRLSNNARRMLLRIRRSLERPTPARAKSEDIERGLAVDALGTLAGHYGVFKPAESGEVWRAEEFVVAQFDDLPVEEKEPTWSSYGRDSGVLSNRFDIIFWDDLVDRTNCRSAEQIADLEQHWDTELETRLEPGGLCGIVGQLLSSTDLYHHCAAKTVSADEDDEDDVGARPMYDRIVYQAHNEAVCVGVHKKTEALPQPDGCLLDPRRLPWGELRRIKDTKSFVYEVSYQQNDTDPDDVLVPALWVKGGIDPDTKEYLPGCWDEKRVTGVLPDGIVKPWVSVATADPSPTKMWCVAEDTRIVTGRGEVPVETVRAGDHVLTRAGWREVRVAAYTGHQPTVELHLSNGRTLRLTPEHLVATHAGWTPAGRLRPGSLLRGANTSARPTGPLPRVDPEVVPAVWVPVGAVGSFDLSRNVGSATHVRPVVLDGEVVDVDAGWHAAQVADLDAARDWCDKFLVRTPMGQSSPHQPVPTASTDFGRPGALPDPAAVGVDDGSRPEVVLVDGESTPFRQRPVPAHHAAFALRTDDHLPAFTDVHVVSITDGPYSDVYDLDVVGQHEFVAEGAIVHNSVQWWLYHPASEQRFLIDLVRQAMEAPDFLDRVDGEFVGLMESWQARSVEIGAPITTWIVEQNAAQRFMLQYDHVKKWQAKRGVQIIGHDTYRNKSDPKMGVTSLKPHWRHGRVRLPGDIYNGRVASLKLVDEVTHYPDVRTDDCVMAEWFFEWNLPKLVTPDRTNMPKLRRPTWLRRELEHA